MFNLLRVLKFNHSFLMQSAGVVAKDLFFFFFLRFPKEIFSFHGVSLLDIKVNRARKHSRQITKVRKSCQTTRKLSCGSFTSLSNVIFQCICFKLSDTRIDSAIPYYVPTLGIFYLCSPNNMVYCAWLHKISCFDTAATNST